MTKNLYTYLGGMLQGIFIEESGRIRFRYSEETRNPISLSLPLDGGWNEDAPANLLQNLLPDRSGTRLALKISLGAASLDPFDLLDKVDSASGLVFSLTPLEADRPLLAIEPADDPDIAAKIEELSSRAGSTWWPEGSPAGRFSLAGSQGKFSLAAYAGSWFWPNADLPSTHIVKPASPLIPGTVQVESASMDLAQTTGIRVATHWTEKFEEGGQEAYMINRFDRVQEKDEVAQRLRSEDILQALGRPPEMKYDCEVSEVLEALRRADPTDELAYEWLHQLMTRYSLGDADSHAKNFSIVHDPLSGIRISPAYDVLATGSWGKRFDRGLAIPLMNAYGGDGCFLPEYLTPGSWAEEADASGLDPERVAMMARESAGAILDACERVSEGVPANLRNDFLESIKAANARIEPIRPDIPYDSALSLTHEERNSKRALDSNRDHGKR